MSNYINPDSLGACGCTDYHMADCSISTGYHDYWYEAEASYYDEVDFY